MLGFCCDVKGKVVALNILAKIGLGDFRDFRRLVGWLLRYGSQGK